MAGHGVDESFESENDTVKLFGQTRKTKVCGAVTSNSLWVQHYEQPPAHPSGHMMRQKNRPRYTKYLHAAVKETSHTAGLQEHLGMEKNMQETSCNKSENIIMTKHQVQESLYYSKMFSQRVNSLSACFPSNMYHNQK